ncbi:hypothetical protein DUNSADRAFT_17101 [Dunaliella salina]|uniref:RAP domain-containing protein n=1 Tax=Dunaliella salina TaxID=3046 RepID=A0ABQ7G2D6_DUNSA|nr:hypothetical protein DUNSADRAFT_17101 [Dunaliella salina]|eukprot:KAF5828769.1 hypothetical protein DUNSADRAFT_17101 [Dunaliella salina]
MLRCKLLVYTSNHYRCCLTARSCTCFCIPMKGRRTVSRVEEVGEVGAGEVDGQAKDAKGAQSSITVKSLANGAAKLVGEAAGQVEGEEPVLMRKGRYKPLQCRLVYKRGSEAVYGKDLAIDNAAREECAFLKSVHPERSKCSPPPPDFVAYCMYNLAKRADMDAQRGVQYSSSECTEIVDAARKLIRLLLEESSSPGAPGSNSQPPIQQLDSKHLSLLAWSLSVMVGFDESLSAGAWQLCYALAGRAAQPRVIRARADMACRNWAGVLYGLAKVGVRCSDDAHVKRVFYFCMEQDLPDLLHEGQKCEPQSMSMVSLACVDAEYEGSIEFFISAVARRIGEPSMVGVGGGLMANAAPQAGSNLLYACAKLEQRGIRTGGGMSIIAEMGAAAMADALQKPVKHQREPQELANTLWGLSSFDCVLAHAVVKRIESSTPQVISNVLWALAKFGWYDEGIVSKLAAGVVSKLAAGMVKCIDSSVPQNISNTLWALSTLGWYDPSVYDALLVALLNKGDELLPQHCSIAMYSCALASHSSSSVNELAQVISRQDVSSNSGWNSQTLANALYAWAVSGSSGIASDSLSAMAQHLMREAKSRGPAAFEALAFTQLHLVSLEAERVELQGGGLSAGNGMLQAAAEQHAQGQAELRKKTRQSGGTTGVRQAGAALQEAGYAVELGGWVGLQGEFYADLLVRHESFPRGIAVDVLSSTDQYRHPPGQLNGKIRLKHAQIRQRCDGLVVLTEALAKQPGLVVQKVEEVMKCDPAVQTWKHRFIENPAGH